MRLLFLFCMLVLTVQMTGQYYSPDQGETDKDWLEQHLYNGIEWQPEYLSASGHEFYLADDYILGDIICEGVKYYGIRMKYDIFNDNLIILWQSTFPIIIDRNRIDSFILKSDGKEKKFINSRGICPDLKGYVEVLHSGYSMVLAKHTKVLSINASLSSYEQFRENTRYYFVVDGICSQIRNAGNFFSMMGDRQKEVKKYMRQNNLIVSRLFSGGFAAAAAVYDSLADREIKK